MVSINNLMVEAELGENPKWSRHCEDASQVR